MTMKILIIANYQPSFGGISGQVELLHQNLSADGIMTDIYSSKGGILKRLRMVSDLTKVAIGYDILHVHCCSKLGFFPAILALIVAKRLNKRIICTYHGGGAEVFFQNFSWIVKPVLNKMDANIILSGFLAKVFEKHNIPYKIVPNILKNDESYYKKRDVVRPLFISVRSLQPLYNVQCIVKAFSLVKKTLTDAQLLILGDGSCRQELENMIISLKLNGVKFVGRVPNSKVYYYLNKADIFISMPHIDNQPMSILEAFKCGLLVISSNVGGVPFMIEDNYTGLLIENDNHKQLADKMIEAVKNQNQTKDIMEAGHQELQKYRWETIRSQLFELYNS